MSQLIYVGLGGFLGASLRYIISFIIKLDTLKFPFVTLGINLVGSILIGFLTYASMRSFHLSDKTMLFLKVGFCGGFTTFSTFSLETFSLIEKGHYIIAGGYAIISVVLCISGVWLGKLLATIVVPQ